MFKVSRPGRMAVAAGLAAAALLGTSAAQSALAAPALSTVPHQVTPLSQTAPAGLNCMYEVMYDVGFLIESNRKTVVLPAGTELWGPQSNVEGHDLALLYSLYFGVNGWVPTKALYEEYCDE